MQQLNLTVKFRYWSCSDARHNRKNPVAVLKVNIAEDREDQEKVWMDMERGGVGGDAFTTTEHRK